MFFEISQNSQENTYARVSFLIKLQAPDPQFIKKETLAEEFSYEFCEIFKNTFFTDHLRATASELEEVNIQSLRWGTIIIIIIIIINISFWSTILH